MPGTGIYEVAADRARSFARALRAHGIYRYSEPDSYVTRHASASDPLTTYQWGLPAMGASSLTPPPVTAQSPLLAIIEGGIDVSHPDVQGVGVNGAGSGDPESVIHGTSVTSVPARPPTASGSPASGPGHGRCWSALARAAAAQLTRSTEETDAGAKVVNMSYGFAAGACFSHYVATQRLYGYGVVLVAAAGNEFQEGNPVDRIPPRVPTWSPLLRSTRTCRRPSSRTRTTP